MIAELGEPEYLIIHGCSRVVRVITFGRYLGNLQSRICATPFAAATAKAKGNAGYSVWLLWWFAIERISFYPLRGKKS